jgi:chaperonin GroEL
MNNTINKEVTLQKLKEGIDTLANVVKTTAGSQGRLIIIRKKDGTPFVTKDGVTIAKLIECNDPVADLGCKLLRQAAQLTVEMAGDNTTWTIIAAQKLFELLSKVEPENRRVLLQQIEDATDSIVDALYDSSKQVTSQEDCVAIATISANGDVEIGNLVGEVVWLSKENGVIQLEEGEKDYTTAYQENGSRYNRPYEFKPLLGAKQIKIAYNNPHVVVVNGEIDSLQVIKDYVDQSAELGKPLVIVAKDFSNIVIGNLVHNYQQAGLKVLPLIIPGYGDEKEEYYQDILSLSQGDNIERIVADKMGFTIFIKDITPQMLQRIEFLEAQVEQEESPYAKENLQSRLSTLCQKVFTIEVGATSEVEMKELKDRVEDAILATKCAVEDGYVLGGGLALRNISTSLNNNEGELIMQQVCLSGYKQILENAHMTEPTIFNEDEGINTSNGKLENFYESRIIDPTRAVASGLLNAFSVIKSILSINGAVIENPNNNKRPIFEEGLGWVEK